MMSQVGHERSSVVLGTRGSKLAMRQSEWVQEQLHTLAPHVTVTLRRIQTSGDKILDVPLAQIGPGTYYVLACPDALRVLAESNEKNNCRPAAARIQVTP